MGTTSANMTAEFTTIIIDLGNDIDHEDHNHVTAMVAASSLCVIIFVSLGANILATSTIIRVPALRENTHNYLIINLNIVSLLITVFSMPFTLVSIFDDGDLLTTHLDLCRFNGFASVALPIASSQTVLWIALDRYLTVVWFRRFPPTAIKTLLMIASTWIVSAIIGVPPVFGVFSKYEYMFDTHHCSPIWEMCQFYVVVFMAIYGITVPTMVVSYLLVVFHLCKRGRRVRSHRSIKTSKAPPPSRTERSRDHNSDTEKSTSREERAKDLVGTTNRKKLLRNRSWKAVTSSFRIGNGGKSKDSAESQNNYKGGDRTVDYPTERAEGIRRGPSRERVTNIRAWKSVTASFRFKQQSKSSDSPQEEKADVDSGFTASPESHNMRNGGDDLTIKCTAPGEPSQNLKESVNELNDYSQNNPNENNSGNQDGDNCYGSEVDVVLHRRKRSVREIVRDLEKGKYAQRFDSLRKNRDRVPTTSNKMRKVASAGDMMEEPCRNSMTKEDTLFNLNSSATFKVVETPIDLTMVDNDSHCACTSQDEMIQSPNSTMSNSSSVSQYELNDGGSCHSDFEHIDVFDPEGDIPCVFDSTNEGQSGIQIIIPEERIPLMNEPKTTVEVEQSDHVLLNSTVSSNRVSQPEFNDCFYHTSQPERRNSSNLTSQPDCCDCSQTTSQSEPVHYPDPATALEDLGKGETRLLKTEEETEEYKLLPKSHSVEILITESETTYQSLAKIRVRPLKGGVTPLKKNSRVSIVRSRSAADVLQYHRRHASQASVSSGMFLEGSTDGTRLRREDSRRPSRLPQMTADKQVALMGGLLVLTAVVCWTPYFVIHSCFFPMGAAPHWISILTMWLGYLNAMLNPLIYSFSNRRIREMVVDFCSERFRSFSDLIRSLSSSSTSNEQ